MFMNYKSAPRYSAPRLMEAEVQDANFRQRAKQQENALRSQNLLGAGTLYNEAMGDSTPIADYLFGADEAATAAEAGSTVLNDGLPQLAELAAPAEGAATAAGEGALAGMGPLGWGAMAMLALNLL